MDKRLIFYLTTLFLLSKAVYGTDLYPVAFDKDMGTVVYVPGTNTNTTAVMESWDSNSWDYVYSILYGSAPFTNSINGGQQAWTNFPDPVYDSQIATKAYVDANAGGGSVVVSNTAFWASNTAYWSSNAVYDLSNDVDSLWLFTIGVSNNETWTRDTAIWASNTASYASNLAVWLSNTTFYTSIFASNTAIWASNTASWASNAVYDLSNNVDALWMYASGISNNEAWTRDTAIWASNAASWSSNTAQWSSNFCIDYSNLTYDTILWASNTAQWSSNFNVAFSNLIYDTILWASNTAHWSSNFNISYSNLTWDTLLWSSNTAQWASNFGVDYSNLTYDTLLWTSNTAEWASNEIPSWAKYPASLSVNGNDKLVFGFTNYIGSSNYNTLFGNHLQNSGMEVATNGAWLRFLVGGYEIVCFLTNNISVQTSVNGGQQVWTNFPFPSIDDQVASKYYVDYTVNLSAENGIFIADKTGQLYTAGVTAKIQFTNELVDLTYTFDATNARWYPRTTNTCMITVNSATYVMAANKQLTMYLFETGAVKSVLNTVAKTPQAGLYALLGNYAWRPLSTNYYYEIYMYAEGTSEMQGNNSWYGKILH